MSMSWQQLSARQKDVCGDQAGWWIKQDKVKPSTNLWLYNTKTEKEVKNPLTFVCSMIVPLSPNLFDSRPVLLYLFDVVSFGWGITILFIASRQHCFISPDGTMDQISSRWLNAGVPIFPNSWIAFFCVTVSLPHFASSFRFHNWLSAHSSSLSSAGVPVPVTFPWLSRRGCSWANESTWYVVIF